MFFRVLALWFLTLGLRFSTCGQTGVYTLSGGVTASLAGVTNSTSTADQSGIFVYSAANLTVGTVNITTTGISWVDRVVLLHSPPIDVKPSVRVSNRRLEFKLSIGFVHPGGFMLGFFMG